MQPPFCRDLPYFHEFPDIRAHTKEKHAHPQLRWLIGRMLRAITDKNKKGLTADSLTANARPLLTEPAFNNSRPICNGCLMLCKQVESLLWGRAHKSLFQGTICKRQEKEVFKILWDERRPLNWRRCQEDWRWTQLQVCQRIKGFWALRHIREALFELRFWKNLNSWVENGSKHTKNTETFRRCLFWFFFFGKVLLKLALFLDLFIFLASGTNILFFECRSIKPKGSSAPTYPELGCQMAYILHLQRHGI